MEKSSARNDITCEVTLRYIDDRQFYNSDKLTDFYLVICGENNCTRKIFLNNFELRTRNFDQFKEKTFEFQCKDTGKIQTVHISIDDNDKPENCLFIDFIEITIKNKSEAYKFPVARSLGSFLEDGKCELELEVWKHPKRNSLIDYKFMIESTANYDNTKVQALVYLIIYGETTKTAKIKLSDGKFEKNCLDKYQISAPAVGKITKLEVYFTPLDSNTSAWYLENIELKIESRNEAYMFPVYCTLDKDHNFLELKPWKKPNWP